MNRKGTGYTHEMLMALFILIIVMTFYAGEYQAIMPPMLMILGAVMVLGGMVVRESIVITGGIVMFAVALIYSEVVLG